MNILYISTVFPKEEESSTIYTDLAEELVRRGHSLTVVVASERKKNIETGFYNERGCRVLRVKTGNMYDVNIIEKGLSILLLEGKLVSAIKKHLKNDSYDLILFEAPPVTLSGAVKTARSMFGAKAFLMMKDIFPQNAVDIGLMRKGSLVEKYFRIKEKKLYAVADNIGCMSEGNLEYIKQNNNIPSDKLSVFPNTKKIGSECQRNIILRKKYSIPEDKVAFVFGGNMGKPQGMDFLAEAIRICENIDEAFFVLVGRGTEKGNVQQALENCKNAMVLDNLPREEYESLISSCDVGIVSLDNRFTIPNYPSRILSYMEYGMAVLATTDKNTDFRKLIEDSKCGFWCESGSYDDFAKIVKQLCDRELITEMGQSGRKYLEQSLTVDKSAELLEQYADSLNA